MSRSLTKRFGYAVVHCTARLLGVLLFGVRVFGRHHLPPHGGALVCANHQSYLDPVIVGLALDRRLNFLARATLFRNPLFRVVIEFLDAIPIDREGSGIAGLKETLRCLKQQELVLVFPEGTRTPDGQLQPLKSGFCAVARRGGQPILPVALDGAFEAWPRSQRWPRLAKLCVVIGEPIAPSLIASLDDIALTAELERRLQACLLSARHHATGALPSANELAEQTTTDGNATLPTHLPPSAK
jgi:1-acyl-sn-glycerol-3-phosphate acyltransferase